MLQLRDANEADMPLVMAWRSNPLVYQGFFTQKAPLIWDEHYKWWHSRKNWKEFIVTLIIDNQRPREIGVVTIGQMDHWSPEIGYFIGEVSLWGNGYGRRAVEQALEYLKGQGYKYTHTTVLKDNKRSLNLLKSLGFTILGDAREGEVWLTRRL